MSNLLEQAIIDASALREVALKNAENALIEKYSKEFKESVEKLLEQEASETPETPASETTAAPTAAPSDLAAETGAEESEDAFNNVPSSFLEGDENEIVTIDFDQLKKQIAKSVGVDSALFKQSTNTSCFSRTTSPRSNDGS